MASLKYLWLHRAKFPLTSSNFYRAWGKRIFTLKELFIRNKSRYLLARKGANISETAEIGEVNIEGPKNLFTVGAFSFLGKVKIALHDEVIIGNNVCINDGAVLLTGSHDIYDPLWRHKKAKIIIDDYVWVGTEAMILPGVHLGRGCVVGARAVVSKSVGAGEIVVGNPAKVLPNKRLIEFNYNPCEFLASNRSWLIG